MSPMPLTTTMSSNSKEMLAEIWAYINKQKGIHRPSNTQDKNLPTNRLGPSLALCLMVHFHFGLKLWCLWKSL